MAIEPKVYVDISMSVELGVDQVWPDGDAPEKVTAQAVKETMESCGAKMWTLDQWGLIDDMEVVVTVENPEWRRRRNGEVPLFGDSPPRFDTMEVWD